ncbi:MAG: hypothetical protein Q9225_004929 [Loekoesia sp. 1 TL-2023]
MELPLELRYLIYREALMPDGECGFMSPTKLVRKEERVQLWPGTGPLKEIWCGNEKLGINYENDINLLLVNKQVRQEALKILHEARFLRVQMNEKFVNLNPHRRFIPPHYFSKICNLEICINNLKLLGFTHIYDGRVPIRTLASHLAMFCYEVASRCQTMRNLAVSIPCTRKYGIEHIKRIDCRVTANEFEELIRPIRLIRALRSIELKWQCNEARELKPIFDRLTAVVKSSDRNKDLSEKEKAWIGVRVKAEPLMGRMGGPQEALRLAWCRINDNERKFWGHIERARQILNKHQLL